MSAKIIRVNTGKKAFAIKETAEGISSGKLY
jgi:hypothetical protein